jgi:sulfatase modifying factor 1
MQRKVLGLLLIAMGMVLMGCPDPAKSTNADLSALTISSGTLTPAFDAAATAYTASVDNAITSVTVTGTAADANASVSAPVALSALVVGVAQTATITVTAQSGATKAYTVAVSRTLLTMVTVPAGSFQRDATATNISTITTAFRMSEKEITMEQFVAVTGLANPSYSFTTVINGPVQTANWYHALVFCNKLSMAEGLTPVYTISGSTVPDAWDGTTDGTITVPLVSDSTWDAANANWSANGYRLPTEMEWMWAAMGATSGSGYASPIYLTGYGKLFAGSNATNAAGDNGSNAIGDYAWYQVNSSLTTHPVGTTGNANELGLYDMSGNVWEWCWDWYGTYPTGTITSDSADGRGAASGSDRVGRGGSWADISMFTVAFRGICTPNRQDAILGFRVVRP